jgi:hypothetical protein
MDKKMIPKTRSVDASSFPLEAPLSLAVILAAPSLVMHLQLHQLRLHRQIMDSSNAVTFEGIFK